MVIWLIGLSGAGKTTLAHRLKCTLDSRGISSLLIDNDEVRNFFGSDLGFSKPDRIMSFKRTMLAAHYVGKTDTVAIVCSTAPFENLRKMAREKISNSHEIYVKASLAKCQERDVKGVYAESLGKPRLIGVDINFDEPTHSDLVIDTDDESIDQSLGRILKYLDGKLLESNGKAML